MGLAFIIFENTIPLFETSTLAVLDMNGGSAVSGDIFAYTIIVRNSGVASASNTVATFSVPTNAQFISGSAVIGGTSIPDPLSAGTLTFPVGTLLKGESQEINFELRVNADLPAQAATITSTEDTLGTATNTVAVNIEESAAAPASSGGGGGSSSLVQQGDSFGNSGTSAAGNNSENTPAETPKSFLGFHDVLPSDWFSPFLEKLVAVGVVKGYGNQIGVFAPKEPITRAEFIKILTLLLPTSSSPNAPRDFPDTENHWAKAFIRSAVMQNWAQGYPDGNFHPDAPISRAEAAKIIVRAFSLKLPSPAPKLSVLTDVDSPDWFAPFVDILRHLQIMEGYADATFRPNQPILRAEAIKILAAAAVMEGLFH